MEEDGNNRKKKRKVSELGQEEEEEDPDYDQKMTTSLTEKKKMRLTEQKAQSEVSEKVRRILREQFNVSLSEKDEEIQTVEERLRQVRKALHLVRYGTVCQYYAGTVIKQSSANPDNLSIHPAVRRLMGNKAPSSASSASATVTSATGSSTTSSAVKELIDVKTVGAEKPIDKSDLEKTDSIPASPMKKPEIVPGYVPPKSGVTPAPDPRGVQYKLKVRFIVGNVSKWIQCDQREDLSTHKWMMYVRGDKENPDVSNLVSKVRFLIHPSYHPHDLIEVSQTPFHLTRRGWGEFPARVQIHFKDPRDKPIDVIHHLKLDKTYTGLQTLGAETVLDVWVHNPKFVTSEEKQSQKTEVEEDLENATDNYNMTETSEGWVICHSKSETMRPNVDEPENKEDKFPDASLASVAEPKMVLKSSNTVKPLESGAMSKPFAANGSDGVGAGPLPSAPTPPPAVAKKAVVSPPSTHTTYIRCKDNDGKAYYLPIKILPNNHQKQVTGLSVAAGQLAGKPQRKPPPPQVGVKYKTKVETAVVFNQNYKSQVGQPQNLSGAESAPSEQRPPSVSLLNGRSSNGNTSSSAQQPLSSLIKTNSFSADRTPGISLSLPSSRFSSPQASPNVSRCSSPLGGQPLNNPSPAGTSLLKSVSLLKPGASLLKRNSVVTMQQHQQQSPSATTIVPHHQVFQQQQKTQLQHQQIHSGLNSAISEQLNHHGFPLHAFQSDLEKSVPGVSLGMWNRVLGRCPEDTQAEIENRIAKRGVHLLKKHSDFHYFISSKIFSLRADEFPSPENCVMYIARLLPLITHLAKDPLYRSVHPYAAKNIKDFKSWNVGKQLAAEWTRAKTIKRILTNVEALNSINWSTKRISLFLKHHGYTLPIRTYKSTGPCHPVISPLSTFTFFERDQGFFNPVNSGATLGQEEPSTSIAVASFSALNDDTADIDILGTADVKPLSKATSEATPPIPPHVVIKQEVPDPPSSSGLGNIPYRPPATPTPTLEAPAAPPPQRKSCLLLPEDNPHAFTYVMETAKEVGVSLEQEELSPRVFYPAAQKVLLRACKNLCEYMIRKGFKEGWDRLGGPPDEVSIQDVAKAIKHDPDLMIFSNRGLGRSKQQLQLDKVKEERK